MILKLYVLTRYLIILVSLWGSALWAQNQAEDLKVRGLTLEATSKQMLKSTSWYKPESISMDNLLVVFNTLNKEQTEVINLIKSTSQAEIKRLRNDLGLTAEAGFLTNFNTNYLDDDDILYRSRWQGGLSWDLLKDGLFDRRIQANNEVIKQEKLLNSASQEFRKVHYDYTYDFIIKTFNTIKTRLLAQRLDIIKEELVLAQRMQNKKLILEEEVLSLEAEYSTTQVVFENYMVYQENIQLPAELNNLIVTDLPIFDLDINKITSDALAYAADQKALDLRLTNKTTNPVLDQVGVKTFIRYSAFNEDNIVGPDRNYFTSGITLRVPLPLQIKNYRDLNRLDQENKRLQNEKKYANLANDILNHYYEFKLHLKQFTTLYYKRLITSTNIEREQSKIYFDSNDYSPIAMGKYVDHLLTIEIELYEVLQLLYLKALKISTYLPNKSISDYAFHFSPLFQQIKPSINSVVLDHKIVNSMPLEVIMRHLKQNKFVNVLVESTPEKADSIYSYLIQRDIKYSTVLSDSRWLTMPDNLLLLEINKLESGNYCLNLDIAEGFEHSMSNWEIKMSYIIHHLKKKGDVSLMMPIWTSTQFMGELFSNDIAIFLKVYEKPEIEYLHNKLALLTEEQKQNISIILQGAEFNSIDELRNYVDKISDKIKISNIAIQNLTIWLKLQFNTIRLNEKH